MTETRSGAVQSDSSETTPEARSNALCQVYRLLEEVRNSMMTAINQTSDQRVAWLSEPLEEYTPDPIATISTVLFCVCATNVQAYV